MRVSILALAFVLGATSLTAQGAPPGQRNPGPGPGGPDDFGDAAPE